MHVELIVGALQKIQFDRCLIAINWKKETGKSYPKNLRPLYDRSREFCLSPLSFSPFYFLRT